MTGIVVRFLWDSRSGRRVGTFAIIVAGVFGSAPSSLLADGKTPGGGEATAPVKDPRFSAEQMRALSAKGAKAFAGSDWDTARSIFLEMLNTDPGNGRILANLGTVAYQQNDFEAASGYLEEALRRNPELGHIWETLGMAYFQAGKPYRAVSALARAVAENPKEARLHNQLAVILREMGWVHGAEECLRAAVGLDARYAEAHFNLALIYLERKPVSPELARRHYRKAVDLGMKPDREIEEKLARASKADAK